MARISMTDSEKLGQFYLGREYDAEKQSADGPPVLYDSRDLVTHGVVLGMTGSGKTGLCLAILEEAVLDNIPVIAIDPKGDVANLMLTFPDLAASDFRPWINEDDAARKGMSADDFAAKTAETWKNGLADWDQDGTRIAKLKGSAEVNIFTPGSRSGIPVSILSSLAVPPREIIDDGELLAERVESTVSSLLSLIGTDADPVQSSEAILLGTIFQKEWTAGRGLTLETLVRHIQKPPFDKVGIMDLDSFLPEKARQALALKFNNLLASPGFSTWLEGPPLDIASMLHGADGKPRVSIFSIAHLGDAERMFFVSLLLNQMLGWMRSQKGTTSLRALLYMDEIFGYLPPSANPPSKKPMMTLFKQARGFGLGCLVATQNPVDLDYKALSNAGTWFLGRLQTERDKLRVLDGLEGAAGSQNSTFDRKQMEVLISGLGNRVFLMNNVHDDAPTLFQTRWVMSYLAGPLARGQIKTLMDPKRAAFSGTEKSSDESPADGGMPGMPGFVADAPAAENARPAVGAGVREIFAPPAGSAEDVTYQPHLLRVGTVHFSETKGGIEGSRIVRFANPILPGKIDLATDLPPPPLDFESSETKPVKGASFGALPGFAMNAANYKAVEKTFAEELYRTQRAELFFCPLLKQWSEFGETEAEFRARLALEAREARDAALDKLRADAAKKLSSLQDKLRTARGQLEKQKSESSSAKMRAGASILGGLLGAVLGKRSGLGSIGRGTSAAAKGIDAWKQGQDVGLAEEKIEALDAEIAALDEQLEAAAADLAASYEPAALGIEKETIKPTRANVKVDRIALLWLPFDGNGQRAW
ncbi:MAG: DUF87 domain-containing protein [Verrucomicrobiota bacterium]